MHSVGLSECNRVKSDVRTLNFRSDSTKNSLMFVEIVMRRKMSKVHGKKIIKHWPPMQTKKSQPSGQWIMP